MQINTAHTFWQRLRGMKAISDLQNTALLIPHCRAIHTWFMNAPIDIYFLDKDMNVVRKLPQVKPWRIAWCKQACHTIEIASSMNQENRLELENAILKKTLMFTCNLSGNICSRKYS